MLAVLSVEFRKLNRSLAAVLAVAAPGLIAVFLFFNMLRGQGPTAWDRLLGGGIGIWAFFMLPMSVTALTALVAHMEHGPKTWHHLRALPLPRWRLYAAKAAAVLTVVALMSGAVLLFNWAAISLAAWVRPELRPTGDPDLARHAAILARMVVAGLLMVVVQLWIALRYASFVPGLVVGIGGTFFSVVATSAKQGVFLPWQMPVNIMATEPWRVWTVLVLGGVGGLVALGLMLVHLSRREVL